MSDYFVGEIRMFPWDWPPKNWALCNGAILQVQQNMALFALLSTTYGGDGRTTFALPDLRGRVIVGVGQLPGGGFYVEGAAQGVENVTLVTSQMPAHNHAMVGTTATANIVTPLNNYAGAAQSAPTGGTAVPAYATTTANTVALAGDSVTQAGGGQQHSNMQPFLVVNYCIALTGLFPSRN